MIFGGPAQSKKLQRCRTFRTKSTINKGQKMRLLTMLLVVFLGHGTHSQSCDNEPLLGCDLHPNHPVPCNNGAGICKDCCRSELGEVDMSLSNPDVRECTGKCKCCGIPDECPPFLCECFVSDGYRTETAIDPITNCQKCFCVPDTCPAPPTCGCPPPYLTEYSQGENGCLECNCVPECPQIGIPVCERHEKLVPGKDNRGCPTYSCQCIDGSTWKDDCNTCTCVGGVAACTEKACPPECPPIGIPVCERHEKLVPGRDNRGCPIYICQCIDGSTWRDDCNTCTCAGGLAACTLKACPADQCPLTQCPACEANEKEVTRRDIFGCPICICEQCPQVGCPIYCPPNQQLIYVDDDDGCPTCTCGECLQSICICGPNEERVEVVLQNGCTGCDCVPKQDRLCPEIKCPICDGGQNEVYGVGQDGCPFCVCGGGCIEGATWKQDCNTCTCSGGVAACTKRACLPVPCPIPVCPQCLQGESPVYAEDPDTGCTTCSCTQVSRCVEGESKPAGDGCNTCTCVNGAYACTIIDCSPIVCPEIGCPICSTDEKQVLGSENGCPVCFCEACPQPLCTCTNGLTPVIEYRENDCPSCGCAEPEPEPCPPAVCGCAPNFNSVVTALPNGCPGCACVPKPELCPQPLCVCRNGQTPVLEYPENGCPTCGCVAVEPEPCRPALCGCAPGYDTVDTVLPDGCPGCACVPKPVPCPQPLCICTGGLIPALEYPENGCPTCVCVSAEPVACPGGFCKSNCDFDGGEYIGPFSTCPAGQFCCNSPETAPCAEDGDSCGTRCKCRTVCQEGEYEDGFCPTDLQDVPQCRKCKPCVDDQSCRLPCPGNQIKEIERSSNGCLECKCLCPPLGHCPNSCTRSLDETTGCFACNC